VQPQTVVLLRDNDEVTRWTLHGRADLATVDELARLQLRAKRLGCRIALDDPCPGLLSLLDLVGLDLRVEVQR
jgi:hypothetical protein